MMLRINLYWLRATIALSLLFLLISCNPSTGGSKANSSLAHEQNIESKSVTDEMILVNEQPQRNSIKRGLKLYPVDEGYKDSSFLSFREELLHAIRQRDSKFILSIVAPNILNSFGGEGGVDEFKEQWKLDQPDSKFWDELLSVLSMGGAFMNSDGVQEFCAPYVASQWEKVLKQLPDSSDTYEYAAVIRENVPLRAQPDHNSPVIDTLSYDILKFNFSTPVSDEPLAGTNEWEKVVTLSGKQGYILSKDVRSPLDYHACFKTIEGRWVMTMFVAGD